MAKEKIKAAEAFATWFLWCQLPSMVKSGIITESQGETLKSELNEKLHEALDIPEE